LFNLSSLRHRSLIYQREVEAVIGNSGYFHLTLIVMRTVAVVNGEKDKKRIFKRRLFFPTFKR
jgi:hypothetical protein